MIEKNWQSRKGKAKGEELPEYEKTEKENEDEDCGIRAQQRGN